MCHSREQAGLIQQWRVHVEVEMIKQQLKPFPIVLAGTKKARIHESKLLVHHQHYHCSTYVLQTLLSTAKIKQPNQVCVEIILDLPQLPQVPP